MAKHRQGVLNVSAPGRHHRLELWGFHGHVGHYPNRRVPRFGVSDWESYYGQTDVERWVIPYFGASAYDDPAIYANSSPVATVFQTASRGLRV